MKSKSLILFLILQYKNLVLAKRHHLKNSSKKALARSDMEALSRFSFGIPNTYDWMKNSY